MSTLKKTLRDNRWACWLALACLVVPMFASYFFDDMFSSLSELFKNPEFLELGWDMEDYGFYASGYSFLCIWGGLVVCGVLLDKFGVRLVGSIFVGMMVGQDLQEEEPSNLSPQFQYHQLIFTPPLLSPSQTANKLSDSLVQIIKSFCPLIVVCCWSPSKFTAPHSETTTGIEAAADCNLDKKFMCEQE